MPLRWVADPRRELLSLSAPLVLQLLSFSAMSFVDTLFVGRLGSLALGAIGIGSISALTIASFGSSLMVGARVQVGNDFGRGDEAQVRSALGTFLHLALWLGLVSILAAVGVARLLPALVDDPEMARLSGVYLRIRALSIPASLLVAAAGQWLNAQGYARGPMAAALIANAFNAVLNAWLVLGAQLGLAGSALATLGAQLLEAALLLYLATAELRRSGGGTLAAVLRSGEGVVALARYFRLGFATGCERVLDMLAFSSIPLLLSYAGPEQVGAHQIALQVSLFAFLPTIALGDAATTLIAQAIGAARRDLVLVLQREALRIGFLFSVSWAVVCILLRGDLAALFTSDARVLPSAAATLIWAAVLQLPNTAYNILKGVLRGLQDFRAVALCSSLCAWGFSPPLTYLLGVVLGEGAAGAWQAFVVEVLVGLGYVAARSRRLVPNPASLAVSPPASPALPGPLPRAPMKP